MSGERTAPTEVRGIVLPTGGADLLLPNAAVAEVVGYREPTPFASAPPWLLGALTWRGRTIPLISVAAAGTAPAGLSGAARPRLVVCNLPNGRPDLPYVCILAAGPPRLARFRASALEPATAAPGNPFVLHALAFADRPAWIPNLDAIERAVLGALDSSGAPPQTDEA